MVTVFEHSKKAVVADNGFSESSIAALLFKLEFCSINHVLHLESRYCSTSMMFSTCIGVHYLMFLKDGC